MNRVMLGKRLRYNFDNTMARGTGALILWLFAASLALTPRDCCLNVMPLYLPPLRDRGVHGDHRTDHRKEDIEVPFRDQDHARVSPGHQDAGMGKIEKTEDPKNEVEANGHQGVDASQHQPIDQLLG